MGHEGHDHDHDHTHEPDEAAYTATGESAVSRSSFGAAVPAFEDAREILHVDPIGGAAGDMLVAALLDVGVPEEAIRREIEALSLGDFRIEIDRREKHAIAAKGFDVVVDEGRQPPRDYATIRALLDAKPLSTRVRALAQKAFLALGEAEAKIHRQPLERVHFHEVGGVDAIVDVVSASAGIAWLEARAGGEGSLAISIAALPVGSGRTRGAHGSIPVPAPAALELMIGLPVRDAALPAGVDAELVTPTGAALLRAWSEALPSSLGRWPTMVPRAVGYGAGKRNLADRPNVVRLVIGVPMAASVKSQASTHVVLEANIDDATPEVAGAAIEALLEAGALDAWAAPITMKKGRPALTVGALAAIDREGDVARAVLTHTTSLGVRRTGVTRVERPRRFVDVSTSYGPVRVKIADGDGLPKVVHPEFDRCREVARAHGVPIREVIRAAIVAADGA